MILLHTQEIVKTLPSAREMVQLLREFVGHYWTGQVPHNSFITPASEDPTTYSSLCRHLHILMTYKKNKTVLNKKTPIENS